VDAFLERGEVDSSVARHDQLTIETHTQGQRVSGLDDLREVPGERPLAS